MFFRKYKYWIIVSVAFALLILFFVKNSVADAIAMCSRIGEMEDKIEFYKDNIRADSIFLENLKDDQFLEKYARERFYMKRQGEQIYLVEE